MACYHPSYIQKHINVATGEQTHKFIGSLKAHELKDEQKLLARDYGGNKAFWNEKSFARIGDIVTYMIQIPCGKCIGCRMDYSRSWADRMTYHVKGKEDSSWFITLTYDDDNLFDLAHSENYDVWSLNYDHIGEFVKKLRNKFRSSQIDYYLSGEYGDQFFRPHFHMIAYNVPLIDLEFWKVNNQGDPVYISPVLQDLWKRGFVTVSPFNWRSAAYTARYVEKKRDGRAMCEYTAVGIEPEKSRCSRRPGIAYDYYMENHDSLWRNNGLDVDRVVNSSGHLGLPRYFRKLAEGTGVGLNGFLDFQRRTIEQGNLLNPLKINNSSFDLDNVKSMLKFEEDNILSKKLKKLL